MEECKYKFVCVPAEISEPVQQWELLSSRERLVESLMDRLKEHFSSQSPEKTAAQLKRQREELLKNLPQGNQVNDQMLAIATSMQMVENIALLSNAPEHNFVGINMYVDDEGSIKQLPSNIRASDIANCCGKPVEMRGDAFLARVFDDGHGFDRQDLLLSEVSSTAQWVRDAAAQNRRKQASASPEQLKAQLLQRTGGAASQQQQQQHSQRPLPPPPPASPAEQAKAAGNKAFAADDYTEAVQQYSKALEADPQLTAARNNRALAHLKLQQFDAAEADAGAVLDAEPRNVKALLRRGDTRVATGNTTGAAEDFRAVLEVQPQNKEAHSKLAAATPAVEEL